MRCSHMPPGLIPAKSYENRQHTHTLCLYLLHTYACKNVCVLRSKHWNAHPVAHTGFRYCRYERRQDRFAIEKEGIFREERQIENQKNVNHCRFLWTITVSVSLPKRTLALLVEGYFQIKERACYTLPPICTPLRSTKRCNQQYIPIIWRRRWKVSCTLDFIHSFCLMHSKSRIIFMWATYYVGACMVLTNAFLRFWKITCDYFLNYRTCITQTLRIRCMRWHRPWHSFFWWCYHLNHPTYSCISAYLRFRDSFREIKTHFSQFLKSKSIVLHKYLHDTLEWVTCWEYSHFSMS